MVSVLVLSIISKEKHLSSSLKIKLSFRPNNTHDLRHSGVFLIRQARFQTASVRCQKCVQLKYHTWFDKLLL